MRRQLLLSALLFFAIVGCSDETPKPEPKPDGKATYETLQPHVVYGRDDRLDLYQLADSPWRHIANATVALIRSSKIAPRPGFEFEIKATNFGEAYNLCSDEPFREQGTAAFCSGFLVRPDVVVTAGHCIRTPSDCDNTYMVFGFGLNSPTDVPNRLPSAQVYKCNSILHTQVENISGIDFAVVRLDRPVTGVEPLSLRQSGTAQPGEELVVIGHPAGLPTKFAAGGTVRRVEGGFLVASLDTYGGNSGSAVLNGATREVEGILVRGEMDFKFRDSCRISNICEQNGCRGEDVTRIEFPRAILGSLGE